MVIRVRHFIQGEILESFKRWVIEIECVNWQTKNNSCEKLFFSRRLTLCWSRLIEILSHNKTAHDTRRESIIATLHLLRITTFVGHCGTKQWYEELQRGCYEQPRHESMDRFSVNKSRLNHPFILSR